MKLKGINPLEQNADKIVLGVVGLAVVGAGALAFLAPGNTIKVGNQPNLPLQAAFDPVELAAQELQRNLDATEPRKPELPTFNLSSKVRLGNALPIKMPLGAERRLAMGSAPDIGKAPLGGLPAAAAFGVPVVPRPTQATASSFSSTISPVEILRHPALAKLVPEVQPFDKAAVSMEASFDGAALRASLEADPDGDGPLEAMPLGWWREGAGGDQVEIVAVDWERETVLNADGNTPASPGIIAITPPPGFDDWMSMWNDSVKSLGDMPPAVERWRASREFVQRPAYYQTIAGPAWKRPSEAPVAGADLGNQARIRNLRSQLDRALRDLDEARSDLQSARPDPRPGEREAGRGGGGGGGGGGKGGAGVPRSTPTPAADPGQSRQAIERKIKNLEQRRDQLARQLTALGEKVELTGQADAAAPGTELAARTLSTLDNSEVAVWAHDITAVPGATYRYRARVVINNPMYGRNLQESQRAIADGSTMRSEWSEWSTPTTVDLPSYFFVTSADERSQLAPRPWATAELFVFYYGYYRSAIVRAEPGDVIAGEAKLPELKFADMEKLKGFVDSGNMPAPAAPAATPGQPAPTRGGRGPTSAPGKEDNVGGGSSVPTSGRGPARAPGAAPGPSGPAATASEIYTINAPREKPLSTGAVMMDVLSLPQTDNVDRRGVKVMVLDREGYITIKMPDGDKDNDAYRKVKASAALGEKQGQPEESPAAPTAPRPRDTGRPEAPRPPGGGGG